MRYLLLLFVLLVSCDEVPAEAQVHSSNPGFRVVKLFEADGCTVYRFNDGNYHYFARCGKHTRVSEYVPCGKGCTREESIDTQE